LYRRAITLTEPEKGSRHTRGRAHLALGELLTESGQPAPAQAMFRQAHSIYERLVAEQPKYWQTQDRLCDAHLLLGRILADTGPTAEAEQHFREAVRLAKKLCIECPDTPGYRDTLIKGCADLVLLLAATGRIEEAEEPRRELASLQPLHASASNQLAWLLAVCPEPSWRDPPRAVALASKAVDVAPDVAVHWRTRGAAHYRAGQWREAIADLERSNSLRRGGDSAAWFFLAMAHAKLDQQDQAHQWRARAVEWMEKHQPRNPVLQALRIETEKIAD
jgi:tetratricopeptide (TPR) repeat protein